MVSKTKEGQEKLTLQIGDLHFNKQLELWQISEMLHIHPQTTWNHVQKYRQLVKTTIDPKTIIESTIIENLSNKKKIIQKAWLEVERAERAGDKERHLRLIDDIQTRKIELFEKLKLIEKNPEKIDLNVDLSLKDLILKARKESWKKSQEA